MITSFFFADGRQKSIPIYSSTNSHEALEFLCHMIALADHHGYSVFEHFSIKNNVTGKVSFTGMYTVSLSLCLSLCVCVYHFCSLACL
jgi:hypothetical protein